MKQHNNCYYLLFALQGKQQQKITNSSSQSFGPSPDMHLNKYTTSGKPTEFKKQLTLFMLNTHLMTFPRSLKYYESPFELSNSEL